MTSRARALIASVALVLSACGGGDPPVGVSCVSDADCAGFDDGDLCNGELRCASGTCALSTAHVPTCDDSQDTACAANRCQPKDGTCKLTPRSAGLVCDDGDPCTVGDRCQAGACTAGKTNLCACQTDADCPDDDDKCNGTRACDTSAFPYQCGPKVGSAVVCKDAGKPCVQATCDPKTGACASTPLTDGAECNDGDPCTSGEACAAGACSGGKSTCGCDKDSDCSDVDGDLCTGVPYCDKSGGKGTCKTNPATVVTCSTAADSDCAKNQCNPSTGVCALSPVKDGGACDDGDACTTGEVCVAGSCAGGTDTCKCTADKDCKDADDGDLCNGTPFCNLQNGKCQTNPATVVTCPTVDDTACAKTVCLPKTGACQTLARKDVALVGCVEVDLGGLIGKQCLYKPAKTPGKGPFGCDDGSPCTQGETCDGKACSGGKVTCDCATDSDCAGKDDGDLCNGVQYCDVAVGKCKPNPGSKVYCSKKDDTACEQAACDAKTGTCALQPVGKGATCDDGLPCTVGDACDGAGGCKGAKANACDDNNPCTVDSCDAKTGCDHKAKSCNDGNACTDDACDKGTGQCGHKAKKQGFVCNADQDGCTVGDACVGGVCKAGSAVACGGKTGVCQQLVCVSKGASSHTCAAVALPDKTPCPDDPKSCQVGASCEKGVCKKGVRSRVFSKLVGEPKGYAWYSAVAVHPSGAIVAVGGERSNPAAAQSTRWYAALHDPTGKLIWSKTLHGATPAPTNSAAAVVTTASGEIWMSGVVSKGTKLTGRVLRFDLDGKAVGAVDVQGANTHSFRALAAIPSGGAIAGADFGTSGTTRCRHVTRLTGSGKVLWSKKSTCQSALTTHAVAVQGNVALELASYGTGSLSQMSFHVRRLSDGAELHAQVTAKLGELPLGVASLGAKGFVLAWTDKGRTDMRRVGLDGLKRYTPPQLPKPLLARGVSRRTGAGDLVLAGSTAGGGFVAAADDFGNLLWHAAPAAPGAGPLVAVAPAGEDIVAVGYRDEGATRRPWLTRTSPFGAASCAAIGACAGKSLAACDDGKTCTLDGCDGKSGCTHDSPSVAVCDPKDGCSRVGYCQLGQCGSAQQGQRFNAWSPWLTTVGSGADAVASLGAGKARVWSVKGATLLSSTWDAWGSQTAPSVAKICSGFSAVNHVLPRFDGSIVISGESKQQSPSALGRYCIVGANGAPTTSAATLVNVDHADCKGCWSRLRAGSQGLDGSTYLVGSWRKANTNIFRAFVTKLSASDKWVWSHTFASPYSLGAHAVTPLPDGGAVVVGRANVDKVHRGLVAAVTHDGKARFFTVVHSGEDDIFQAAAVMKSGTLLAAGRATLNASTRALFLAGLDAQSGKVLWQKVSSPADLASGVDAVAEPTGGAVVTGNITVFGQRRVFLDRIDDLGARVWRRTYLLTSSGRKGEALSLRTWSGGYLIGARTWGKGTAPGASDRPVLIKTDKGGYDGCLAAGGCVAKTVQDCDDKDPCTADWCHPSGGCQHHKVAGCP